MDHVEEQGHITPYGTFVKVWLLLLVLTATLVFVSTVFHDLLSVPALLTITPLKAGLVFFYFMHLKYERPFLKGLVLLVLVVLIIFIGLTFSDIANR
ncbi:MAG: cytochrome C oxidase subunit IV family protein [Acidobacteriales bacterium]|nr:cytochrome C oxidase subunit IV family protein [Terriglobales bacterium]